jgi:hypothetical protein
MVVRVQYNGIRRRREIPRMTVSVADAASISEPEDTNLATKSVSCISTQIIPTKILKTLQLY